MRPLKILRNRDRGVAKPHLATPHARAGLHPYCGVKSRTGWHVATPRQGEALTECLDCVARSIRKDPA